MKKINHRDECSLCKDMFYFVLRFENENVLLCENCAKELYQKLGRILVPKGLPNMIMRATNNSTLKSLDELKVVESKTDVIKAMRSNGESKSVVVKKNDFQSACSADSLSLKPKHRKGWRVLRRKSKTNNK